MAAADHTDGAMIALVPAEEDAQRLAVDGYEPPEALHVTLVYLGDDASSVQNVDTLEAGLRRLAAVTSPLNLTTWATSEFNPTDKQCACYLVGKEQGSNGMLDDLHDGALRLARNEVPDLHPQHVPWIPHLTVGYDLSPDQLSEAGAPVVFDRLRLAVGPENIDIPLTGGTVSSAGLAASLASRLDRLESLIAAPNLVRRAVSTWNELLHPRGRDGRFIEKGGFISGKVYTPGSKGNFFDADAKTVDTRRAKVVNILPNPSNADDPLIEVELEDGSAARGLASQLTQSASVKARLDEPAAPDVDVPADEQATLPLEPGTEQRGYDTVPGDRGTLTQEQVDALSDEQLVEYINTIAANLSQDNAEERAAGLDALFATAFRTPIDTEKTHNHLGEDGDQWTTERVELHEQIWTDLISKIDQAGVPKERDALALGGLPGAGKSSTLRPGGAASSLGVVAWDPGEDPNPPDGVTHVSINPDSIKEMLIDAGGLPPGIEGLKPMEQVTFIHEESSVLSKLFLNRLASEGYNLVLDNTMETPGGMKKRMIPLATQNYSFRGLFVDIDPMESKASATGRYARLFQTERGGRFVPSTVVGERTSTRGRRSANRDAFDELAGIDETDNVSGTGWFTEFIVVDNTGVAERNPLGQVTLTGQGDGSPAKQFAPESPAPDSQQDLLERTTTPGPSNEEKIRNAAIMFGEGSPQHLAAKKKFG